MRFIRWMKTWLIRIVFLFYSGFSPETPDTKSDEILSSKGWNYDSREELLKNAPVQFSILFAGAEIDSFTSEEISQEDSKGNDLMIRMVLEEFPKERFLSVASHPRISLKRLLDFFMTSGCPETDLYLRYLLEGADSTEKIDKAIKPDSLWKLFNGTNDPRKSAFCLVLRNHPITREEANRIVFDYLHDDGSGGNMWIFAQHPGFYGCVSDKEVDSKMHEIDAVKIAAHGLMKNFTRDVAARKLFSRNFHVMRLTGEECVSYRERVGVDSIFATILFDLIQANRSGYLNCILKSDKGTIEERNIAKFFKITKGISHSCPSIQHLCYLAFGHQNRVFLPKESEMFVIHPLLLYC